MIQPGQRSPDGRWVWNGTTWVPALPPPRPAQPASAGRVVGWGLGLVLGGCAVLMLTSIVVIVILLTMGNQIQNVFRNVVVALNGG
jgi:hypothetical protein